jgi:hypothetical protein
MAISRLLTWRGILHRCRRSELDRKIDRKIAAALARILEAAAQEAGPWRRLRLIWAVRRFH